MRFVLPALVTLVGACALDPYVDDDDVSTAPTPLSGTYAVESRISLAAEMPQIERAVAGLSAFSHGPARELLGAAQRAADPTLAALQASLSPALRDRLAGWIDVEIDERRIAGKSVRLYVDEIRVIAMDVLGKFTLESSLSFGPTNVMHAFKALTFTPASLDILIPIGGLDADAITQNTTASIDGQSLTLGDQRFGLAYGNHAWQALGLASSTLFGAAPRAALTAALDCRSLATAVAARCFESSCVGHAPELEAICTRSIDLFVAELGAQIATFDLDVFRFVEGNAALADDDFDGVIDRIIDGMWSAETDIGLGLRTSEATFSALRPR